jgi:hypothetical protein
MHRKHAIEDLRRHEVVVWIHQLHADDDCFDPADQEEHQRVEDVEDAQPLVVDSDDPVMERLDPWPADDLCGWNGNRVR